MANTKISALPNAAALGGTEQLAGVQAAGNVNITPNQLATFNQGHGTPLNGSGASDPTTGTDSSAGYAVGSLYFNTTTAKLFVCRSASVGAAVWNLLGMTEHPGYVSGHWYFALDSQVASGNAAGAGTARFISFALRSRVTLQALSVRTTVVGSSNTQLAIYANNPTTGHPTGLSLAHTADIVNTGAAGNISAALTSNTTFEPGIYWFATNQNDATVQYQIGSAPVLGNMVGAASLAIMNSAATTVTFHLSLAMTYGTWIDVTASSFTEDNSNKCAMPSFQIA